MSEWKPIETAPKDGRPFIAYRQVDDENEMWAVVWWHRGRWRFGAHVSLRRDLEPTHWQPLPSRPAAQAEGAQRDMEAAR